MKSLLLFEIVLVAVAESSSAAGRYGRRQVIVSIASKLVYGLQWSFVVGESGSFVEGEEHFAGRYVGGTMANLLASGDGH